MIFDGVVGSEREAVATAKHRLEACQASFAGISEIG